MYNVYLYCFFIFLWIRRPPRSTRPDTLFPYTTLFRSKQRLVFGGFRIGQPRRFAFEPDGVARIVLARGEHAQRLVERDGLGAGGRGFRAVVVGEAKMRDFLPQPLLVFVQREIGRAHV